MTNSRAKGIRGELQMRDLVREYFPGAHEVQRSYGQSRAGDDAPDVEGTPYWIEVELAKKTDPKAKLAQAMLASAGDGRLPIAFTRDCSTRRRGLPWLATMRADQLLALLAELEQLRSERGGGDR